MIHKYTHKPTKQIKRLVSSKCTKDFTSCFENTQEEKLAFSEFPNLPHGLIYDNTTALYLTGKSIAPHRDPNLIIGKEFVRGMFWVTRKKSREPIYIQVENEFKEIKEGEFVIFQDYLLHCITSDGIWEGVAVQCYAD